MIRRFWYFLLRRWLAARAADMQSAAMLAERGYAAEAFRVYARCAQAGQADAQFEVGLAYLEGRGTPPRRAEALRWLERAATQRHVNAVLLLITLLLQADSPDFAAAEHWARAAAEQGVSEAQAMLGHILSAGPARNPDEAHRWLEQAAAGGSVNGMFGFAVSLAARNDPADGERVAGLIRRAAEAGHGPAARALGQIYLHGAGVARDPAQAAHWLRLAVDRGDAGARAELEQLAAAETAARA